MAESRKDMKGKKSDDIKIEVRSHSLRRGKKITGRSARRNEGRNRGATGSGDNEKYSESWRNAPVF